MSYIINTYNGNQLTVIADGTVDNTTELSLVGKNYSGYGTFQNDNFIYLLENFANVSAPTKPISGQLWFDNSSNKLKVYDKNLNWKTISGADTSTGFPSYLTEGDFWFDTIKNQLYVYSTSGYKLIGPPQVESGTSSFQVSTVTDTSGTLHDIITASVKGTTIFTVSNDATFTLLPSISPISGFIDIHPGLTLANTTDVLNPGYTTQGVLPFKFYGTSTNTDTINIIKADASTKPLVNATVSVPTTSDKTSVVSRDEFGDIYANNLYANVTGTINQANTLLVGSSYESASIAAIPNTIAARDSVGDIYANTFHGTATVANSLLVSGYYYSGSINTILNGITGSNIAVRDNAGDIYANTFHGTATLAIDANSLLVGSVYESADTAATNSTIVARDSVGDIYANTFHGTATLATDANSLLVGSVYESADTAATNSTIVARDSVGDIYANTFHGIVPLATTATNAINSSTQLYTNNSTAIATTAFVHSLVNSMTTITVVSAGTTAISATDALSSIINLSFASELTGNVIVTIPSGVSNKFTIYNNASNNSARIVGSVNAGVLTVTSVTGTIYVGQVLMMASRGDTYKIIGFLTGSGGLGTYSTDAINIGSVNMVAQSLFTVTLKTTLGITTVDLPLGKSIECWTDGSDMYTSSNTYFFSNQAWTSMTINASGTAGSDPNNRFTGVWYYNNTALPIQVVTVSNDTGGGVGYIYFYVTPDFGITSITLIANLYDAGSGGGVGVAPFIVPPGWGYKSSGTSLGRWTELR